MKKDTNEKPNTLLADVMDKAAQTGKKGMDAASTVLAQTADKSKELAGELAKGAKALSEKAKEDSYNRRMKLYNPLFPEEYFGEEFFVPNIIQIVDDAVRRDIDVCKGAIGWRGKKKGVEVLFLYDEFVNECGLQFVPKVECNDIYYVDPHDRKRFIQIDKIFEQTQEEKIAELENIAYCLGAKICTIEIEESEIKHDKKQVKAAGKQSLRVESIEASREEKFNAELQSDSSLKYKSKNVTKFKGNDEITTPKLKWFAYDDNMKNLIEFRCKGGNAVEEKTLTLKGASSATMSRTAAASIDTAVSEFGLSKQSYAMEANSIKESSKTFIYHLEF